MKMHTPAELLRMERVRAACEAQSFHAYSIAVWGENWAMCRATPRNLARYGRCITQAEYARLQREYAEFSGRDPLSNRPTATRIAAILGDLVTNYRDLRKARFGDTETMESPSIMRAKALLVDLASFVAAEA